MPKAFSILILACLLAACSPEDYRRSADAQVDAILRDREKATLDYRPQVDVATTVNPTPGPRAYDPIPTTPLAPPTPSPIEPAVTIVNPAPLGPPNPGSTPASGPTPDLYGMQTTARPGGDNLSLGPPAPGGAGERLDLFGALEYGVQHSRQYQTRMEEMYLSALDVTLARHLFEPRPFVKTGLQYTGGQRDVAYRSALNATASAGVRQQLPYGGEIVAETLVGFVNALNGNIDNGETAEVALSGAIPLLRGAGMVNLEPLISGEREVVYQIRAFEQYRRSFVVDIAGQYFNLLTRQQAVANRRFNYRNLATLTARTQSLYEAGKISFLEVQRSLQALLNAESSLVNSQENYQSAVDAFKIQLGMPVEEDLTLVGVELAIDVPDLPVERAVELANAYRLDLRTAADRIEDARRGVDIAKNGLLPDLSLNGRVAAGNPYDNPAADIENRTLTYEGGVTLDLPVDRLAERNQLRRNLIALQRAQRNLAQNRSEVSLDTRNALRAIQTARQNLRIEQLGIDLARRRLDYANELLKEGKVTARDVVEAQSSLLLAQDDYDTAKANLQISVLRFLQATGTLRVDPGAGALGRAMDRMRLQANIAAPNR